MIAGTSAFRGAVGMVLIATALIAGCPGGEHYTNGPSSNTGDGGVPTHQFVFVETPVITHDRDYHAFQYNSPSYVPTNTPTDWTHPVDYTRGIMRMSLNVLEVPEGSNAEFYYTVTFTQKGKDFDQGWLRPAIHVTHGPGSYEDAWPVMDTQYVWNDGQEHTASAAGHWDFTQAYDKVAGDVIAWPNASFPITVKVRITVELP